MLHFLKRKGRVRWLTFVILELRRLRQEDCYEFEASLDYIESLRSAWATE